MQHTWAESWLRTGGLIHICEWQSPGSPEVDVKGQGIPQSKVPPNNDTGKEQGRRQEVYNVPG